MWALHEVVALVTLQMVVLMTALSVVQFLRAKPVNKTFFTGVLFSGGLVTVSVFLALVGLVVSPDGSPSALNIAYWMVAIVILPAMFYFERQSDNQVLALRLYTIGFVILLITVYRAVAVIE